MRKGFAFGQDLKPSYGNTPKPAPVVKIRKPTSAEQSYQQALKDKREMDVMRHIKRRQKYIDDLGEEAGKKAFYDSLQKFRHGTQGAMKWGEKIYQDLISDMKIILGREE